MRAWVIEAGATGVDGLRQVERPDREPGPGEVLVRVRACSLNYRDQLVLSGNYFGGPVTDAMTPLSDGVGEVLAIGAGVSGFAPGDRVAATFFPDWADGPPNGAMGDALGAPPAKVGMLAEQVVLPERGLVPLAPSLSFEEAATLPCAALTAWNALMEGPRPLRPGDQALLLGTGGVSIAALQIARAAGASVIITSSSDEKLDRARALGATKTLNYRSRPDWGAEVARIAGDPGVTHVVEIGGLGTLAQSMQAIGYGGEIAMIGLLAPEGDVNPFALLARAASIRGVFVGSRAMALRLNTAIETNAIRPVVDRVFPFDEAPEAYRYQSSDALFGKVVIAV